ncbi:MAG TPA: putative Ig domain-containing protein [Chitinophagaceae bacterium]
MKKLFLLSTFILISFVSIQAQTKFWDTPDAYLRQTPAGNTPELFAPKLLADSPDFSANRVAFSGDGKEFYYCSNKTWANNDYLKINCFKYQDRAWKGPFLVTEHRIAPTLSPDDRTLYFDDNQGNIWESKRTENGWSEPAQFPATVAMYDFTPTNSGIIYAGSGQFIGADKKPKSFDVCTITTSGSDTLVQSLGIPVNAPGWNGDFFISRDESFLIISAKENRNFECELYISFRKPDKTWTNPKSLGPQINNDVAHRYGQYVTNDNKFLFYCYAHSEKDCAIYWVRFDHLLDSLKHSNFDPYVFDSLKDQVVSVNEPFHIQVPKKTFVDDDGEKTLTYTAHLSNDNPLPSWIHFDPVKKIFSGKGTAEGSYNITVLATDTENSKALCSFTLTLKKE